MNQGWECPKCGKCYAPTVVECFTCGHNSEYSPYSPHPKYPITWGTGTATTLGGATYYTVNYAGTVDAKITPPDEPQSAAV